MISDDLMGDVWPTVQPGRATSDYARVTLAGSAPCEVRSWQELCLTLTVGRFGFDDTGGFRISLRFTHDGGALQSHDPGAANYISARSSTGVRIAVHCESHGFRPWDKAVRFEVVGGALKPGDKVFVTIGDRSGGAPGFRMQTFCESAFEMRVAVDPCATGFFVPLEERIAIPVVPGPPVRWKVINPTARRVGTMIGVGIVGEDLWGNASDRVEGPLVLRSTGPALIPPVRIDWVPGARSHKIEHPLDVPGTYRFALLDGTGATLAEGAPLAISNAEQTFWADLHGQSGETVGINSIEEYFTFARDIAFVDACAHQANDFQIKDAFWDKINTTTRAFNDEGRFVTFPGYEWSANTAVGGDHNVYFRDEGRPIIRSSHAMIEDRHRLETDANDLAALYAALAQEDCVLFAHVGGRPANLAAAHDPRLRTAVELHSDWGTFEWMIHDSFRLGHRVGVVCSSDGHKGRPGASYPGAASFGALGGLTCFRADALDRDSLFDAIRRRNHYGTTGSRLHLDVRMAFDKPAEIFHRDPATGADPYGTCNRANMGEIARSAADMATVNISVSAGSPILSVDLFTASQIVATFRSYTFDDLGNRLRILCNGAEYRGRGRQTLWTGAVTFSDPEVVGMTPINWWNPERPLLHEGPGKIRFEAVTTGNFCGFDVALDRLEGTVHVATNIVEGMLDLADLGVEPRILDGGGLERAISMQRLPDRLETTEMTVSHRVRLFDDGDTPVWVRVRTEDGHVAWSSPIYVIR
ncbi:MAG: hypothetical protein FD175_2324 [Beijerinckiaceae bacterium]|nr:MAG: hypothetical protein FD175_2324 [Beijerinckiaceae bacterium]